MPLPDELIGRTLGRYRLVERIGAGGMGVVYRARDERLNRDVAVKVLPPDALAGETTRRRFRHEALALSRLNHPNIATVHDFDSAADQGGVDFLVMEFVPGRTLDERLAAGPLPEKQVAQFGADLARGLAAAHAQGIAHRDLKPSNLRVTPDGRVKILDFGLARLLGPAAEMATTQSGTNQTGVPGTLSYMAPEQLRGEAPDLRSDLYAAGAVLYEMATGRRPFEAKTAPLLIDAILHASPITPSEINRRVSAALAGVIVKALDKNPERRYQSARELLVDLERLDAPAAAHGPPRRRRWVAPVAAAAALLLVAVPAGLRVTGWRGRAATPPRIASIAVLPLANLSGDPGQEYFADGMTEALIGDLARVRALRVISRTSVMQYKGTRKSLPDIAAVLGVDAVIEGSVTRAGNRVRITADLIHVRTDRHLWAEQYERDLSDVLTLQREVARAIVREVQVQLTPQERAGLATVRRVVPEAHELYLKGRYLSGRSAEEGQRQALAYFSEAVARDPAYAAAHAAIADTAARLEAYGGLTTEGALETARRAADTALRLDPDLADAYSASADIKFAFEWDWNGAEAEFKRALDLEPSNATTYERYSSYLAAAGRADEALAMARRARDLDPLSSSAIAAPAMILYYARRPGEAIDLLRNVLTRDPSFIVAHYGLALVHEARRDFAEAASELQLAMDGGGRNAAMISDMGRINGLAGRSREARRLLDELTALSKRRYVRPDKFALIYAGLGDKNRALALLNEACDRRSPAMVWARTSPRFDSVRNDPRFDALLRRVGGPTGGR